MEIFYGKARITENVPVTAEIYSMRLIAPEIARRTRPGQFVMLRIPGHKDPLLGRPLAVFRAAADVPLLEVGEIQVLYAVVGKATGLFRELQDAAEMEIWGPLGNGFPEPQTGHLVLVAGGIGYTAMREISEKYRESHPETRKITFLMGGRSADALDRENLAAIYATETIFATDDGTLGHRGFVTELLPAMLAESVGAGESPVVMACGPTPMLQRTAEIAAEHGVKCYVSLETPMACGMGICFTCVAKIRTEDSPGGWDYCRTCVEGPVFEAGSVVF